MFEGTRVAPHTGGIVLAGGAAALLFCASVLPAVHEALGVLGVLAVVSPFPLGRLRLVQGLGAAMVATLVAALLVAALFSPTLGGVFLVVLAAPTLLIAESVARGYGLLRGCAWAGVFLTLVVGLGLASSNAFMEEWALRPVEMSRSEEFLAGLRDGGMAADQVDAWVERVDRWHAALQVVYPAAYFILAGLLVTANALLLRAWVARRRPEAPETLEPETLRWPLGLAVAFCTLGAGIVVPLLRPMAYNGLLVVAFLYALQGMAVVGYYLQRLAGPPLLRGALLLLVLLNPWAPQILALLGLFDTWLDFRRWADPPTEGDGASED